MRSDYPSFREAVDRLRAFLDGRRWPVEIRWLRPGNHLLRGRRVILHPDAFLPHEEARTAYWHGVPKKHGVLLAGLCRDADHSFCHVWTPSDPDEAERHLMPDGLKLSVPADPPEALVTKGWRLRWHRGRSRKVPLETLMILHPSPGEEDRKAS